jgi:hypothetical protein
MIFSRRALKNYAELRTRGPSRERQARKMRKIASPDALAAANAIAHAARRPSTPPREPVRHLPNRRPCDRNRP